MSGTARRISPGATAVLSKHTCPPIEYDSVSELYPSRARLFRHAATVTLRVAAVCTALCYILQPGLVAVDGYLRQTFSLEAPGWTVGIVAFFVHSLLIFGYAGFFAVCERFGCLQQYRVKCEKHMKNPRDFTWKAFIGTLQFHFGHRLVLGAFMMYAFPPLPAATEPDSVLDTFLCFGLTQLASEIVVYGYHRLQHRVPWLYRMHKVHHEFHATEVLAVEWGDLTELALFMFINYISTAHKAPIIHVVVVVWKMNEACEGHSGYSFRGTWLSRIGLLNAYRSEFHSFHHSHNVGVYALNIFMDYACGTADEYLKYLAKQGKRPLD